MTMQKVLSYLRRAVEDYRMIEDGDKIAVGLSGGKDSTTLLAALKAYSRFSPEKFELTAITIDLGLGADYTELIEFCASIDVPYHIEPSNIAEIIFDERKEKSPCSLCSKMRRGALNTVLNNMGFTKLALGHHVDDLIETFFLSLFYEGRVSTFAPKSFMDRTGVTLIRPLVYMEEKDITAFSTAMKYPVVFNPCPVNHNTKREDMKNLIKNLTKEMPAAKERIIGALTNPERNNLWKEKEK